MSDATADRTAGYRHLAWVTVHQVFVNYFRYPINVAGSILGTLLIFVGIVYGGRAAGIPAMSESTAGLVIGYYLFMLAGNAYQGVATMIQSESEWGTLERHFVSPFSFERVVLVKAAAHMLRGFALATLSLVLVVLVTQEWISFPPLTVVFVLFFSVLAIVGVGLAMGGLAVVYKRIGALVTLFNLPIIGLVGAPILQVPWLRALPIVHGSSMLQRTMSEGVRLWEFAPSEVGILVAVALGYFVPGLLAFRLLTTRARRLGVLGDY